MAKKKNQSGLFVDPGKGAYLVQVCIDGAWRAWKRYRSRRAAERAVKELLKYSYGLLSYRVAR